MKSTPRLTFPRRHWLTLGLLALSACGGNQTAEPVPAQPASTQITGLAVDGPLQGATACYDSNDNGACDIGEPSSAPAGADGRFALNVPLAEAGLRRLVVEVPASGGGRRHRCCGRRGLQAGRPRRPTPSPTACSSVR